MTTAEVRELVAANMKLVGYTLHRAFRGHLRRAVGDTLYSAGLEGLLRAAESFDPARGMKFSTWASACIRNAVVQALVRWKRDPASRRGTRRLDAPLVRDEEEALGEVLPDVKAVRPPEAAARSELCADVVKALAELPRPSWGEVVMARAAGSTVVEVARARGVSKQCEHQLYHAALARLGRDCPGLKGHLDG
jgi:RNA polymerase sigma factor (sigma-70 family)